MSKFFRTGLILGTIILFGAGCAKGQPAENRLPAESTIPNQSQASGTPAPVVATEQIPPPEPETEKISCPVTPEIVKNVCGLSASATLTARPYSGTGCSFEVNPSENVLFVRIAGSEEFGKTTEGPGAAPGATVQQVVEAARKGINNALQAGARAMGMEFFFPCASWETRLVAGIGDEALMAPFEGPCEKNDPVLHINSSLGASLYTRKGSRVAQVMGVVDTFDKLGGCSPDEITKLAKDYIVPAM